MGASKLLLPIRGRPLIASLVESLGEAVERILILVRCDDLRLQDVLADLSGVTVVLADREPPDMRHSVQQLLAHLDCSDDKGSDDGWLLTPADHPIVAPTTLEVLCDGFQKSPRAVHLPVFQGRRGHPAVFPGWLKARVPELPPSTGINALLRLAEVQVVEHEVGEPSILWDLDTPEDYGRFLQSLEGPPT